MSFLSTRSGLHVASHSDGDGDESLLQAASDGLGLPRSACGHYLNAIAAAVAAAADPVRPQPQRNDYSVFIEDWHAESLAGLSDEQLRDCWRLAGEQNDDNVMPVVTANSIRLNYHGVCLHYDDTVLYLTVRLLCCCRLSGARRRVRGAHRGRGGTARRARCAVGGGAPRGR
jgi:hypothetical protein